MSKILKLGILISGSGTNLQSIIDNCNQNQINAKVEVVISSKAKALGLKRAEEANIPGLVFKRKGFKSKKEMDLAMVAKLKEFQVDLVCLAGYMRVVSPAFLEQFPQRVINIHPSLLPSFPGLEAQVQALNYGVKISGCTVHFVDEKVDHGPIIIQATVPVMDDDTLELLQQRILQQEHVIYPKAIDWIARGMVEIKDRLVVIKN